MIIWWIIFALASAVFTALQTILTKKNLFQEHALEFNGVRGFFSFIIISVLLLPFIDFSIPIKVVAVIYCISLAASVGIYFSARSVRHLDVSLFSPLQNISPFFLVIFAFLILGEVPSLIQFLGIFLLLVGTYFLEIDFKKHNLLSPIKTIIKSRYIHFTLFAMLIFSLTSVFDKFTLTHYADPITFMFFLWLFISLHLMVMESYTNGFGEILKDIRKSGKLIFLISFFGIIQNLLYILAINLQNVSLVVPLRRISTLFSTILGGKFFHEKNLSVKITACIILIIGAVLIII
ncbi:MAG: DMT family transporter [Candidatus Woesearchaeota archaeon]